MRLKELNVAEKRLEIIQELKDEITVCQKITASYTDHVPWHDVRRLMKVEEMLHYYQQHSAEHFQECLERDPENPTFIYFWIPNDV